MISYCYLEALSAGARKMNGQTLKNNCIDWGLIYTPSKKDWNLICNSYEEALERGSNICGGLENETPL